MDILTLPLGKVRRLVERLPPGAVPDTDSAAAWSVEMHMLANLVDQLQWLTWVTVAANSKRPPERPTPVRRPGYREPPRQQTSWSGFAKMLGGN